MKILLIYHYFAPEENVSARMFSDLAAHLAKKNEVTVLTGDRYKNGAPIPPGACEAPNLRIIRCRGLNPRGTLRRLLNAFLLQFRWLRVCRRLPAVDAVIAGSDPPFAFFMFPSLRRIFPAARLIHWAFDLYPEAILASPVPGHNFAALFKPLARRAYRSLDVMVDIDETTMRRRLREYKHGAKEETITPWAVVDDETPPQENSAANATRAQPLKLLYSGTVGYAHDLKPFIALARECRRAGIAADFTFAGNGNRWAEETAEISAAEDTNIHLEGFVPEAELRARLLAADIHLASVRAGWEGIVVPSKYFAALAMGRPVIWSQSAPTAATLAPFLDRENLLREQKRVRELYEQNFSREKMLEKWDRCLATKGA